MEKPKKIEPRKKVELTKEELQIISNLLFTGKWNLSLQENNRVITPLINKIAKMIDLDK